MHVLSNSRASTVRVLVLVSALFGLFACEASKTPPSSGSVDFSDEAGHYKGTASVKAAAPGFDLSYERSNEPIEIIVAEDGKVTVTLLGRTESRYISGRTINTSIDLDEKVRDYACVVTVSLNAQFSDDHQHILGTLGGDGTCNDGATTSPLHISGELVTSR